MKSLSKLEADVLEKLLSKNKVVFKVSDLRKVRDMSINTAYYLTKSLLEKGHTTALKKGTYVIDTAVKNDFKVYTDVFAPSYVSLWTAFSYYGFTEQVPMNIHLVTSKRRRSIDKIDLHYIDSNLFLGYKDIGFPIATKEKTIFDLLWFNLITLDTLKVCINGEKLSKSAFRVYLKRIPSKKKYKEIKEKLDVVGLI